MDDREVGRYWESNARAWTTLSRQGWDVYRDTLNTPAFLELLPEIGGHSGLDIGCGDGHNTRQLAARGARMAGIDVAPTFIESAREAERENPLGIQYSIGSAQDLPFASERFDFATAFMSLMDMPEAETALREAWRVLRSGGFLQFSITHPCFFPPHRRQLRNERGEPYAVELGRYFDRIDGEIDRWTFSAAPPEMRRAYLPFEIPRFHRTLSEWLNAVVDAGFTIERIAEPHADKETARRVPHVADTRIVAYRREETSVREPGRSRAGSDESADRRTCLDGGGCAGGHRGRHGHSCQLHSRRNRSLLRANSEYTVRLYRPRTALLNGTWKLPEAQPLSAR